VNEFVDACGADGLFIQALGIERAVFQSGDLSFYQCSAILEILRAILSPDLELPLVGRQRGQMRSPLVGGRRSPG